MLMVAAGTEVAAVGMEVVAGTVEVVDGMVAMAGTEVAGTVAEPGTAAAVGIGTNMKENGAAAATDFSACRY